MDVALAALDLAAELAVKCVEPLFTAAALQEATGGFMLQVTWPLRAEMLSCSASAQCWSAACVRLGSSRDEPQL